MQSITTNTTQRNQTYNMRNSLTSYYLLVMFTFFELFLTNQYARARTDKFILFICLTVALAISVLVVSLSYSLDKNAPPESRVIEAVPIFKLSITDICFILFFVFALMTTLVSDYKIDSLLGSSGRDNGLLLIALYLIMYLIVSRFYVYKDYVLIGFLVCGIIVATLTVVNFFYFDPINIFAGYSNYVINDFGSTIGNKNTISSFMCLFLPFAMMMFVINKNPGIKIISAIAIMTGYTGLLCANSISGYLGLCAMIFLLLLISVRHLDRLKIAMLGLTIMFGSAIILRIFSFIVNDENKGFEAIPQFLIYSKITYILPIVCLIIYLLLFIFNDKPSNRVWPKKALTICVCIAGGLIVAFCGGLFIYYTFIDKTSEIGSLSKILRFNEKWGTHRGYFWIKGMEEFAKFDSLHILLGSGCDTFYHVFSPYFEELSILYNNSSTDCAHNEYLNYLVTQGILGLAAYLGILATTVIKAIKTSINNKLILIFVAPVICYCAQAVVNIYQPITTPFLFIFIALCECLSRGSHPLNKLN